MKNSKHKVILLASCLLAASLCMPVLAHAEEMQDNTIGVTDVVILQKYLHGKQSITQEQFTKLDRNHDSLVNIYDFVLLKKELISGKNTSQLQAETRIDTTTAVNCSAWESATSDESYVIQSVQELNEIISPMFHAGVVREFNQIYDETFFENNVLLLDLEPPESQTIFKITGCEYNSKNQLEIQYEKEIVLNDVVLTTGKQLIIGQVAIPKDQYHDNAVIWRIKSGYVNAKTMEEPIAYEFKTDTILSQTINSTLDEKILITTQEELIEFLAERFDEETVATYQELYPAEFFETKNIYLEIDVRIEGDEYSVWRVTETTMQDDSKHISIYSKTNWGCGDIGDYYLN
ncbi:MAG: dockerin type I repeat-containing protein, partial [Oscillospiraceae bacterium]|nr:dockerin type I repeat-containing protein [Oscillospiraceae bacterium]